MINIYKIVAKTIISFLVFFNFSIYNSLYAPPLNKGGLKCKNFLNYCKYNKSKECMKHTNWALALTANIGDNKIGFEKDSFFKLLFRSCQTNKEMFIENLATTLDIINEAKNKN